MSPVIVKDPDAVVDYTLNWGADYLESGETISTSTWTVTPTGLTKDSDSNDTTTTTIFVSGGTRGKIYRLTNKIVTSKSRTDERSLVVRVEQR